MITDANIVNVLPTLIVLGECYHSNFLTCLLKWEFEMVSIHSLQFKLETPQGGGVGGGWLLYFFLHT